MKGGGQTSFPLFPCHPPHPHTHTPLAIAHLALPPSLPFAWVQEFLNLTLASLFWKRLVGETVSEADLLAVDENAVRALRLTRDAAPTDAIFNGRQKFTVCGGWDGPNACRACCVPDSFRASCGRDLMPDCQTLRRASLGCA